MIVNSIGDSAILIVIGLCLANFETLNFESIILYATKTENIYLINTICILLLVAVMSKSAQIGLHI
jgi:NADH:ubiquinone oxidoreductase subunit 5 (subunit L)/multisubunit Na+/H+ antiporter MnhA subunit